MVINHTFQDIVESLNETKTLCLPTCKENALKLNFSSLRDHNIVYHNHEPPLPFAANEVFNASISSWRRLTTIDDKCKDVYEISLDIKDTNFNFKPGDTIGIIPQNCPSEIESLIEILRLKDIADLKYTLSVDGIQRGAKIPPHVPVESTLRHVLTHCVDLRGILKKLFILALSKYTKDEEEKSILEYLCSKEGSLAYTKHILNKHMCLLDLLVKFKSCQPPVEVILGNLPRLLPRPYSIVNKHKGSIKICFSVMDIGNSRKGITTGWLESIILNDKNIAIHKHVEEKNIEDILKNLDVNDEIKVPIFLRKNIQEFWLPKSLKTPIILIGPGTGVSPFIGFLEEREYLHKMMPDVELGYVWLFFGCRHPKLDFIYENELNNFKLSGVLNKLTATFSRYDHTDIRYVQDAITQNGEELTKLILQGAHVYVCGNIKEMAASVRAAIVRSVEEHGDITREQAEQYIGNMMEKKRYLVDIWN